MNTSLLATSHRCAWTLLLVVGCRSIAPLDGGSLDTLGAVERARVDLGQRLFFDPRLSDDGTVACASCHLPADGGDDGRAVSTGIRHQPGRRNAPTVLNAGLKQELFWDGRAATLEAQALMPLRAPDEMGARDADVLALVGSDSEYARGFAAAFPGAAVDMDGVAAALAAYQRRLLTPGPVDAFLRGDASALDARAQRGLRFFQRNCAFCHDGPGVGGQRLQRLGFQQAWPAERTHDLGRYEVTKDDDDRLVFAVPMLRNVARTGPYFHDGSVETLEEAVRLMGRHQLGEELSEERIAEVAAFLRALSAGPDPRLLVDPLAAR